MAMDDARFEQMVARLERESEAAPRRYQMKVALLALLGLGVLALIVGVAGLGLALLAGLAVAMLMTGGKALIVLFKLGKLLILLAWPMWHLVRSAVGALFMRLPEPQGSPLQREQAPALFEAIDQMRRRMKGPQVHQVLLTDDLNAAIVQRPRGGVFGLSRNYLILGLPLLEGMPPQEALAVVAHEYGHLSGSHGRFAAYVYRLRQSWARIQALGQQWQGLGGRFLQRVVGWYAPYFNAYTFVLARGNEYQADRASADLVGAEVAARALKRINLIGPQHEAFMATTLAQIRQSPMPPDDVARQWSHLAVQAPPTALAQHWLETALQRSTQVHDTHPTLNLRLRALADAGPELSELPPPLAGQSAASQWLGAHAAELRQQFDAQWSARVRGPWRERHLEMQKQAARLAELAALESPDRGQQLEMLQLRSHWPDDGHDQVADCQAFNARHPDDAAGLFAEGCARLDRDDEAGLDLLERAMALDAVAVKPACERAQKHLLKAGQAKRAQSYARRWAERQVAEQVTQQQLDRVDPSHALLPAELPLAQQQLIRDLLKSCGQGVRHAYFARRQLPADPSIQTYVLALSVTLWARLRRQQHAIVKRVADGAWPSLHAHVVVIEGRYKPLRKKMRQVPGAQLQ